MFYIRKMVGQRRQLCLPVWHPTGCVQLHRQKISMFLTVCVSSHCCLKTWYIPGTIQSLLGDLHGVQSVLNRHRKLRCSLLFLKKAYKGLYL
jgi:hypothetical protein